ncbi:MAG: hypothetical protein OFPII_09110 [Osedax symbiont Rs1]|nr:MAG: hypothetical protein OFPII_09110 [Osedax symbiont Rs1]
MSVFNNLSFRNKLLIPITLIAILFLVMGLSSLYMLSSIGKKNDNINLQYLPITQILLKADTDLHQVMLSERTVILNNGINVAVHEEYLKDFNKNLGQALKRVPQYQQLSQAGLAPNHDVAIAKFISLIEQWKKSGSTESSLSQDTLTSISTSENEIIFQELRDLIDVLLNETMAMSDKAVEAATADIATNRTVATTLLVSGITLCLLLIIFFPQLITRRLKSMLLRIQNIAEGDGDLTARLEDQAKDEIGEIAQSFDKFVDKLQRLITDIVVIAENLDQSQQQLTVFAESTTNTMSQQQGEVDQVATAITEMAASAQEIALNAEQASQSSSASDQAAQEGLSVIDMTQQTISQLSKEMEHANRVINSLQENSVSIGSFIEVINSIAGQTNLLALNAAIEAARAGSQGRGFAVVADEVRTLAGRTQKATTEVQTIINALQNISKEAVTVISNSDSQTKQAVSQIENTGASLQSIAQEAAQINQINNLVASASNEQTLVTESLNENIARINDQVVDASSNASMTRNNCSEIAVMVTNLRNQLAHFKV